MNEISDLLIILCWPLMTFCEQIINLAYIYEMYFAYFY